MKFHRLEQWLSWQEQLNPAAIELGLERVRRVWQRLTTSGFSSATTIITVAGTNGKGSTVAMLESVLGAGGYSTCSYTSPHLLRYNERIRIDGRAVDDVRIMQAFQSIEDQRGDDALTYFEYGTLAALLIGVEEQPDVMILEVGLGGRLDAVNIVDADLAIISSIGLDHQDWLGKDLNAIGAEKAGIMRKGRPAVYSSPTMPDSIAQQARAVGARLWVRNKDFTVTGLSATDWNWCRAQHCLKRLPVPGLSGRHQIDNAAGILMALDLLSPQLPLDVSAIRRGLAAVKLAGRHQQLMINGVLWILDVAHNPHAVNCLAQWLEKQPSQGRTLAVFGMLQDKDAETVFALMQPWVDEWLLAGIPAPRGLSGEGLKLRLGRQQSGAQQVFASVADAVKFAQNNTVAQDRVVVFGSFHTVSEALAQLQ